MTLFRERFAPMRLLYLCVVYLLAPLVGIAMLLRGFRDHSYWSNFGERFGFGATAFAGSCLWVHAVSVGEIQASAALVRALRERYPEVPLVVTTVTPTGAQRARALFAGLAHVRYVPYDLPGSVRRFFARVRPRVAIILETELWPNLYHECGRRGVPLVLASARISPRSIGRYRRLAALFREALANGIVIAAQSPADAERFRYIGANPLRTHVMGNIKFDFALSAAAVAGGAALRAEHASGRPVWVAGSTHAKEEDLLLDAHRRVREQHPGALLILVPRHPTRFAEVRAALEGQGVRFAARSRGERCEPDTEVYLGDTLGELVLLYAAGDVAFVGGSLVPIGGHNLLEPAALGLPLLTGPFTFNAEDIAKLLIAEGAAEVVSTAEALSARVVALFDDAPERARIGTLGKAVVEANRGALSRLLALLAPVIAATATTAAPSEQVRPAEVPAQSSPSGRASR
ncbi:MAG TPA: lipid IV(A) 3-deoxy-D-manno-octulosonic acid transferase [Steroidobacteraceae bacterium]|nr:lipid IV(A) 3-deoxy-D-manno-octulosonic acid transferase [Steroidobacteraceae bacterium]HQZ80750.1 lipid IV(A) 3-deoxy-D-manno-octulosonic acid transferase [Steroidobacteraceae bacterium]